MEGTQEVPTQKTSNQNRKNPQPFEAKTLKSISEIISVVGWLIVGLGGLAVVGSIVIGVLISIFNPDNDKTMALVSAFMSGLGFAFLGLLVVSSGQLITCFVQIERNTNVIVQRLEESK